ncbi:hypothetical protein P9B03_03980 [Metasolibacillus meyeri]|uniref:Phage protein n=1 Tax=Metasolibacillus meyeri TaxID=1071052 RepID=A0AAW9NRX8_9BACL|nr:hypothetical protein [Metasolibacillus meyeri]MEC1177633.1 hypothetical protein [Metasolibacillus meyeri]
MSQYRWLLQYQEIENEIRLLEGELARYKRELRRWTIGDLYNVKLTSESKASKLEEIIQEVEQDLAHKMNDLYEAEKTVNLLSGLNHRILYLKHVKGKTLIEIADELGKSPNYIYGKHAEIMRMLRFKYET